MRFWIPSIVVLTVAIGMASCNTDNDDGIDIPDPFFVSFEIDTTESVYTDGEDFYGNAIGINWYPDSIGILYSQSTSFQRAPIVSDYENDVLSIQMVQYYFDSLPPTYNESFRLFEVGIKPYGGWSDVATNLGVDGVIITYTDSTGRIWTSDKRAGDQESWASFEITEQRPVEEKPYGAETKGTFNCRVFDGTGGELDLRNGQFYARTVYKPE